MEYKDERKKLILKCAPYFIKLHEIVYQRSNASISTLEVREFSETYRRQMMDFIQVVLKLNLKDKRCAMQSFNFRLALKYWLFAEMVYFYPWEQQLRPGNEADKTHSEKRPRLSSDTGRLTPNTFVDSLHLWLRRYCGTMRQVKIDAEKLSAASLMPVGSVEYWNVIKKLLLCNEARDAVSFLEEGAAGSHEAADSPQVQEKDKNCQLVVQLIRQMPHFSLEAPSAEADGTVRYSDVSQFDYEWNLWFERCHSYCQAFPKEVIGVEMRQVLLILAGDEDEIAKHTSNWLENFVCLAQFRVPLLTPAKAKQFLQQFPRLVERIQHECSAAFASTAIDDPVFQWTADSSLALYRLLTGDVVSVLGTLETLDSWSCAHFVDLLALACPEKLNASELALNSKYSPLFPVSEHLVLRFVEQNCVLDRTLYKVAFEYIFVLLKDASRPSDSHSYLASIFQAWITHSSVIRLAFAGRADSLDFSKLETLVALSENAGFKDSARLMTSNAAQFFLGQAQFYDALRVLSLSELFSEEKALLVASRWLWTYYSLLVQGLQKRDVLVPSLAPFRESLKALVTNLKPRKFVAAEFLWRIAEYHWHRDKLLQRGEVSSAKCAKVLFAALASPACPKWAIPSIVLELVGIVNGSSEALFASGASGSGSTNKPLLALQQLHDLLYFVEEWTSTSVASSKLAPAYFSGHGSSELFILDVWHKTVNSDLQSKPDAAASNATFESRSFGLVSVPKGSSWVSKPLQRVSSQSQLDSIYHSSLEAISLSFSSSS